MKETLIKLLRKPFHFKTITEEPAQPEIIFDQPIGPKLVNSAEMKVAEFSNFLPLAVKFADTELIAVGTGEYLEEEKKIRIDSIYPILNAKGTRGSVQLDSNIHRRIGQTLDRNNEKDEVAVLHTHPGFSSRASGTDDAHGIRTASLLFDGKAVMIIIDPLSSAGVDVSAYAIEPESKAVIKIPFRLVP